MSLFEELGTLDYMLPKEKMAFAGLTSSEARLGFAASLFKTLYDYGLAKQEEFEE